jgi:opacity protein-like surface antigen
MTFRNRRVNATAMVFCVVGFLGAVQTVRPEVVVSIFSGIALTENNDLRLRQDGGTDLTFHDVSYKGRDFESPQYYGGRLSYFLPQQSHWGFGAEFFHMKMYLNAGDTVHVTGSRAGVPVNDSERIDNTIQSFSISHGLNFLTLDAIYRWLPGHRDGDFLGRFQPYVGVGIGAVIPHVESTVGGVRHEEYQWHGPGVQGFGGLNFDLARHLSLFVEYKLTYANLDTMNIPGGSIAIIPFTHHLLSGLSVRF